jgi:RimJ/RimL family protein N-acetyltransferase
MAAVLDDRGLHEHTGGSPATAAQLRARYGHGQGWLNWSARRLDTAAIAGTVQATLAQDEGGLSATLAWVIVRDQQGRGYASEAALAIAAWLHGRGVDRLVANIHPDHNASIGVARRLGLVPGELGADGEVRWSAATRPAASA